MVKWLKCAASATPTGSSTNANLTKQTEILLQWKPYDFIYQNHSNEYIWNMMCGVVEAVFEFIWQGCGGV